MSSPSRKVPLSGLLEKALSDGIPVYGTFLDGDDIYGAELSADGILVMETRGKESARMWKNACPAACTFRLIPAERLLPSR